MLKPNLGIVTKGLGVNHRNKEIQIMLYKA
jgi:hypothetical protein